MWIDGWMDENDDDEERVCSLYVVQTYTLVSRDCESLLLLHIIHYPPLFSM